MYIELLFQIALCRTSFEHFTSLISYGKYKSLIKQLLTAVFDPDQKPLTDLKCLGSSSLIKDIVGGFLSSFSFTSVSSVSAEVTIHIDTEY